MTTELSFDNNGFLIPHEGIETDFQTLEKYFVKAFPNSMTRKIIFKNYEKFNADFRFEIFKHFEQWIGGSFVSRKENPNDIDVVTFLDDEVFALREYKIDKFWSFSLQDKLIDSYIVRKYSSENKEYKKYLEVVQKKHNLFSTTRNGTPKGYLKLKFSK